ncbi:MAG: aldehyde dehydrogenase family protein [Pseudomonadota bacterium]
MRDLMLETARAAAGELVVLSPYDGRVLDSLATADAHHVDDALSAAQALYRDRDGWLSVPQRIDILHAAAERMAQELEPLTLLAASEGGKPYNDSKVEVLRAIDGMRLCAETLRSEPGKVIPLGTTPATTGRVGFTQKEPIGVVVAVSAFNHPLNLIVHQVGPAVASGCPVIVKPADDTPLSCVRLVEILRQAGLPDAWCQVLIAHDIATAESLVTDARVAFFSFIGSARVGWSLRAKLAPGTRCALEHGGVAPLVLAAPFQFDPAIEAIAKGGFYHAGQVCVSVQRVLVPTSQLDAVTAALVARANALTVGAPEHADTDVGPLIRAAEVTRIDAWVQEAIADGAICLCGGKPLDFHCYAPTVLLNPPLDAKVSTDEVFGPVICVYGYDDLEDAIAQANALPVSFQAAVFCDDIDTVTHLYTHLDASAVMVNDHSAFRDDAMPFAGLRVSGLGVGGIPYTMHDMQIDKMLVIKSAGLR